MMLTILLLVALYCSATADLSLHNVLNSVDDFFINSKNTNVESVVELMKRSHNIPNRREKRNIAQSDDLQHVSGFDNVIFSDKKFPVDLNSFTANGITYFVSLHESLDHGGQSNAPILRIENLNNGKGQLLQWIQFESVGKVEIQNVNDNMIIAVTQPQKNNISGQCLLYQLQNNYLKQIQTIDVGEVEDIKFTYSNNEVYLAISREEDVMIFKWFNSYFDKVQQLASQQIKSMSFFNIDGILNLATVGNSTISGANCWIWQLNLDTNKFQCKLNAEPYAALDVQYFQLQNEHFNKNNHFIAVAYGNEPSIVYKLEDNSFQPFQIFYHKQILRWLPYGETPQEKVLFSVAENGLEAYIYDGWRFKSVGTNVWNTTFGEGCKAIRSVKNANEQRLIGINFNNQKGEVVKPSFNLRENTNPVLDVTSWCDSLVNYDNKPIEKLQNYLSSAPMTDKPLVFKGDATFRNVKINKLTVDSFGGFNQQLVEEINEISKIVENIEDLKSEIEELLLAHSSESTIILKGPIKLDELKIEPSTINDLSTDYLNDDDVRQFFENVVDLSADIDASSVLLFNELRVKNITTNFINGRPAESLISLNDELNISQLIVNGNLSFDSDVKVEGEVQGVIIDREHAILVDENQTFPGQLLVTFGNINDLKMTGSLNSKTVEDIMNENATDLPASWESLNVLNLTLKGELVGPNIDQLPAYDGHDDSLSFESVEVDTGIISGVNISDLVRINHGSYRLNTDVTFDEEVEVENLNVLNSVNDLQVENIFELLSESTMRNSDEPLVLRNVVGNEILVKGDAVFSDIVSNTDHSLSVLALENNGTLSNNSMVETSEEIGDIDSDLSPENNDTACEPENGRKYKHLYKMNKRYDESGNMFYEIRGSISLRHVYSEELFVSGNINNLNWTELTSDAVRKSEMSLITGPVVINEHLEDAELIVDGDINKIPPEQFMNTLQNNYLIINETIEVTENIIVNGKSIFEDVNPENDHGLTINNVHFIQGLTVNIINNKSIDNFISSAVYKNRNMSLGTVYFIDNLEVEEISADGLVNDGHFNQQIFLLNNTREVIDYHWVILKNLHIDGNLTVLGKINGIDVNTLCNMTKTEPKIIVGGSVKSTNEPIIGKTINQIEKSKLIDDLWFKNKKAVLRGNAKLHKVHIWEPVTLNGLLNNYTMDQLSKGYLSKTIPRYMRAPLFISNLTAADSLRATHVTGSVNEMNITAFAGSVLQYDIEQNFTVSPEFEEVHLTALDSGLIDGLNFSKDILRYDVNNAVVTGSKIIDNVKTRHLDLASKVQLQKVNMADWVKDAVQRNNPSVKGNVSFTDITINGVLNVDDKVGPLDWNSQNLLTVKGSQKILGRKTFLAPIEMAYLDGKGLINDVDIRNKIKLISESDGAIILTSPVEVENIDGNLVNVEGDVKGVNLSDFCQLTDKSLAINDLNGKYLSVANSAHAIYENIAHGAYYLDHFKVIQKFRSNVSALALLPGNEDILAVFRQYPNEGNVSLLFWDSRSHIFKPLLDKVVDELTGNVTLAASGSDFLYVEKWNHGGHAFYKQNVYFINSTLTTCAIPFESNNLGSCLFLGQDSKADQIFCSGNGKDPMKLIQQFKTTNCMQASTVKTEKITWLAVIGSKMSRPAPEIFVTVFSLRDGHVLFNPRQDLPVLHPVSVSTISHGLHSYLVVASKHQPESVRSSLISIFRYSPNENKWRRYQEIPVEAPLQVAFEKLPTGQLSLYVLTANPTRAFLAYLYKGVEGFVEETAGLATHSGSSLSAFHITDHHFVGIVGKGYGQLLQAEFKGSRLK